MCAGRHISWLVSVLCVSLQGCYTYKALDVKVVDAESGEPVPNATVWVGYENIGITYTPLVFLAPHKEHQAVTGRDGIASLRVHNGYPPWAISAPAYIGYEKHAMNGRVPDDFTRTMIGKKRVYVAALYREPRPVVWIIVPDDYRGPVRMSRIPTPTAAGTTPGARFFEFHVSVEGDVRVCTPPLLSESRFSLHEGQLRFRFENGEEVPRRFMRNFATVGAAAQHSATLRAQPQTLPLVSWDYVYGTGPERELFVVGDVETWLRVTEPFKAERGGYFFEPQRFEIAWNRR